MALSRKTQPDRPIWPVAPDSGGSPVQANIRTAAGRRTTTSVSGAGQKTAATTTPSEGLGSFAH